MTVISTLGNLVFSRARRSSDTSTGTVIKICSRSWEAMVAKNVSVLKPGRTGGRIGCERRVCCWNRRDGVR